MRELATGTFLDAKRNAIFIGGTGTGKTHLCIAVASAVIRARARGRFFNLVDLVNQLEQEKAAGRSGRLAEKLLRHDLIVIAPRRRSRLRQRGRSWTRNGGGSWVRFDTDTAQSSPLSRQRDQGPHRTAFHRPARRPRG